jgi:hypothetical protein
VLGAKLKQRGIGCRFYSRCVTCPFAVCLIEREFGGGDFKTGSEVRFLPDVPESLGIRPLLSSSDVRLIFRAFDCYLRHGAVVKGDGEKVIGLSIRMLRKVGFPMVELPMRVKRKKRICLKRGDNGSKVLSGEKAE